MNQLLPDPKKLSELGTAREVISRLLKQMETEGLVELGRNRITLTKHP